ncbi:MADF domain [Cinara cedri]|uniref:MADF domain n=1 Tax=Cinara cedri TaxID=506608 RepID=A0A5E4NT70_9HEMI|nr:MADF domain [Cinara cedri]
MHFIDYYEKEEVLWNTKLQSYRNRDARGEAMKRIVLGMNIEGLRPDHVISKFKNLKSSYCQELKKIATSKKSGTSLEDVYVPHVVWCTKINSFLKPYMTMRDTCSNYFSSRELISSINELESNLTGPDISINAKNTNNTTIKRKLFKSPQKRDWNLKKRKFETFKSSCSETDTVLAAVKQLDSIVERAQKLAQNSKSEDSFDQFGKYIVSVLRDYHLKNHACYNKR